MSWREDDDVTRRLGRRLRQARLSKGLTQDDVADAVKISRCSIANYENGRTAPPVDIFLRLAAALSRSPEILLHDLTGRGGDDESEHVARAVS